MKKYLTILIAFSSLLVLAEPSLNNKTPVPTIKAAQESGFYEGANGNPTMTAKQRKNKQEMEDKIDNPPRKITDPNAEHQRVPLVPNP